MPDVQKLAESVIWFADYFSVRIILLVFTSYVLYLFGLGDSFTAFLIDIRDYVAQVLAFIRADPFLSTLSIETIVPFATAFLGISILEFHKRVLDTLAGFFPIGLSYRTSILTREHERALRWQWESVSGSISFSEYRHRVEMEFYRTSDGSEIQYPVFASSLYHYSRSYIVLIVLVAALPFFDSGDYSLTTIIGVLILLLVLSVAADALIHLIYINNSRRRFYNFISDYNQKADIAPTRNETKIQELPPLPDRVATWSVVLPRIYVYLPIVDVDITEALKSLFRRVRDKVTGLWKSVQKWKLD